MTDVPASRAHLATEGANPAAAELDRLPIERALAVMQAEDARIHEALAAARPQIARAIELVAGRLARGGRLFYLGAGTSGRLGVLDAVECPPTFQSDPGQVQGLIAGGQAALTCAVEGAEDDREGGAAELVARGLEERDAVVGISAGGTTPYVHGALELARSRGAATVMLACVPFEQAPDSADVSIRVVTGPEVVAGSTRLKAGTATKLVLNAISTLSMVRLGKVHGNLMVDVDTRTNAKLVERAGRIVSALTGLERGAALALLERAGGQAKLAVVMHQLGLDAAAARERLHAASGFLRRALDRPRG
jgi:N-acetylmuramic acid 6-phosphate etherase